MIGLTDAGSPDIVLTIDSLAVALRWQGRFAEAESLLRRSIANQERARRTNTTQFASTLHNLGTVLRSLDRSAEAEKIHKQSLDIFQRTLPPAHPSIAASLSALAILYTEQQRYAEAEPELSLIVGDGRAVQAAAVAG